MINKYTYFDNLQYENISRRKEGSLLHLFLFRRTIYALMYTNQGETVYSNKIDTRHQSDLPSWRMKKASESTTMIRRTRGHDRKSYSFEYTHRRDLWKRQSVKSSNSPATAKTSMFYIFFRFVQRKRRIIRVFLSETDQPGRRHANSIRKIAGNLCY